MALGTIWCRLFLTWDGFGTEFRIEIETWRQNLKPRGRFKLDLDKLWGGQGSFGEFWGVLESSGELWGALGNSGEVWRILGSSGELWGALGISNAEEWQALVEVS